MANTKQIGPTSSGASAADTNSQVDLQVLHEIYWQPHGALVDAGMATMMCSYAQVNGVPSCQYQELMNYTVRGDYGFKGIVMSDWGATHSTAPSIEAGLDWEMGFQIYYADHIKPVPQLVERCWTRSEGAIDSKSIKFQYNRTSIHVRNLTQ